MAARSPWLERTVWMERFIWVAVLCVIAGAWGFSEPALATAATVSALLCGSNFTVARLTLGRVLTGNGRARLLYGFLYTSKFLLLLLVLGWLIVVRRASVAGVLLGFSVLPGGLYLLLARELMTRALRRRKPLRQRGSR